MNRKIFMGMSSWSQLFFLLLFSFCGLILSALLVTILSQGSPDMLNSMDFLRVIQPIQAIFLFLMPALLCAYLFHNDWLSYLQINKYIDMKILLIALLLMISIQPLISISGHYNQMMRLPESLSGLEQVMKRMEESATLLIEKMLTTNSISVLLMNIFAIAIMAGLTEEFFFRGSIQQIIHKICKNKHFAVWISALIFSAIHFQFYGFFPRTILGALLGYLFVWSGNLWIPVIAHAFNNLMSILVFHYYHGTPQYDQLTNIGTSPSDFWVVILSVILTRVLILILQKNYRSTDQEDYIL